MDIGRVSHAYASAHDRTRVHSTRLYPREKRALVADFNGAIPRERTIVQAEWRMEVVCAAAMSNASIAADQRSSQVMLQACYRGYTSIRCQVTLDNGEIYNQQFVIEVLAGPYFGDENTAAGPQVLTVTEP